MSDRKTDLTDEQVAAGIQARRDKEASEARQKSIKFYGGMVIAAAGLAAAFLVDGALYLGFGVAMVGAGIVPFDKLNPFKK